MKESEQLEAGGLTAPVASGKLQEGITLQTETMIATAGTNKYIAAAQHRETKKWHGVLMVKHPTPSGCERWLMAFSDNRGFENSNQAIEQFLHVLPIAHWSARIMGNTR